MHIITPNNIIPFSINRNNSKENAFSTIKTGINIFKISFLTSSFIMVCNLYILIIMHISAVIYERLYTTSLFSFNIFKVWPIYKSSAVSFLEAKFLLEVSCFDKSLIDVFSLFLRLFASLESIDSLLSSFII